MAAIGSENNGHRRILFVAGDGSRKTLRLGKATMKQAEAAKIKIEALVGAAITGSLDDETSRWVAGLDDRMHARLAAVGLVKSRSQGKVTLGHLVDEFFKHLNVKPITVLGYQGTKKALLKHFGAATAIRDIEPLQADQWRAKMKAAGLAEATLSKRVKLARQMFRQAVRWKMLTDNPFADVKAGSQMNKSRQRFVSREDAQKVLESCPDTQWKLIFALSRFGGLRCPSEHLALTWADVDWERSRIRVTCSKTAHHEGRGERFVPLFNELRPYLLKVFEEAEPGTGYVITRYRAANANLRTQFQRIIRRAGLTPWPRLFHNLRSTRQTELAENFPSHVVCAWIGNTERVAENHYLQTTDAHFAKAVALPVKEQTASNSAAQNPAQYQAESERTEKESEGVKTRIRLGLQGNSAEYVFLPDGGIAATGIEPVTLGL
jgi:integrase